MKKTAILLAGAAFLLSGTAMASEGAHWSYSGQTGPEHWGNLAPEYEMCMKGKNQSPVDLSGMIKAELPPLTVAYRSAALDVINNGHTVQANSNGNSKIVLDGHAYTLKQVHFHTPSENRLNGKSFPMEAHFVHADEAGHLAVLGLLYDEGPANASLSPIWDRMPAESGKTVKSSEISLNMAAMVPNRHDYYRFNGSLTTPPCSEGVLWLMLKDQATASREQIEKFHGIFGMDTNRPVQPLNSRVVLE